MIRKTFLVSAAALAVCGAAEAALVQLEAPIMQQTGPGAVAPSIGVTEGSGTWTWDTETDVITQSGTNTFTFGPNLPAIVGYVFTFTDMVIDGSGATSTASGGYTCIDGNLSGFIGASICGGYNFGTNLTNESTLSADASTRVIGGDDFVEAPTVSLANAFNDGANAGGTMDNRMVVRDTTTTAGVLRVRPADLDPDLVAGLGNTAAWGDFGSGWEMRFTIVPVPAAVWLFGSALGLLGWVRRRQTA